MAENAESIMNIENIGSDTFNYVAVDQLQDLLLPPETPAFNTVLWLGLGLLICLLALGLWRWKKHRNTALYLAQKNLHALQQQSKNSDQASQEMAVQCASFLCQGLGVKRLDQYQPKDINAWDTFQNKLNKACYSEPKDRSLQKGQKGGVCASTPLSRTAFSNSTLIEEAKRWLERV